VDLVWVHCIRLRCSCFFTSGSYDMNSQVEGQTYLNFEQWYCMCSHTVRFYPTWNLARIEYSAVEISELAILQGLASNVWGDLFSLPKLSLSLQHFYSYSYTMSTSESNVKVQPLNSTQCIAQSYQNLRNHTLGINKLQSHPLWNHLLYTHSYALNIL
jgi:hypothetical protein